MKILLIVIVIAVICTFVLFKKGKIKDQNNNNIPDFIEDAVEEVKDTVEEVVEVVKPQPKKKVEAKKEAAPKKKVVKNKNNI